MQNTFKRVLSVLFVVAMLFSSTPMTQIAGTEIANPLAIVSEAASKKTHLKKTKITLTTGETYTQKLLNKKGKTIDASKVTWKSKNKKVAKVSKSGKVTAVKAGKTTITAKYKGKTYKFTVTVKNASLKYNNKTIRIGESFKQKLFDAGESLIDASKITWKSSDKSIAKISANGKVTGLKKGTAKITAKYKEKEYKFKVTVKNPYINLSETELTLSVGFSSTLKAKYKPSNAEIKWKSSNKTVAKVSPSGVVRGVNEGTATITASIKVNGKTYRETCEVTVEEMKYGDVTGSVTYFYNNYRGNVADTGAKVILVSTDGRAETLDVGSWYYVPDYYGEEYGVYYTEVDGSGQYFFDMIPVGEYEMIIISDNTSSGSWFDDDVGYAESVSKHFYGYISEVSATELGEFVSFHKYETKTITVRDSDVTHYSYDFGITYI